MSGLSAGHTEHISGTGDAQGPAQGDEPEKDADSSKDDGYAPEDEDDVPGADSNADGGGGGGDNNVPPFLPPPDTVNAQ